MNNLRPGNIGAVFRFEWKRSWTVPRMAWWVVLAVFPSFITGLILYVTVEPDEFGYTRGGPPPPPDEAWAVILFGLVSLVVSALGVFLWSTPAVAAELEQRSWIYIATRPNGNIAVLIGKYLVAVSWALSSALAGLTLALLMVRPDDGLTMWTVIATLTALSCPAFGAVYSLIGVALPRRAMVFAIGYTLLFEVLLAFVPAMIKEFTIQFRLRCLLVRWLELDALSGPRRAADQILFNDAPAWQHVAWLLGLVAFYLAASVVALLVKEFSTADESDM